MSRTRVAIITSTVVVVVLWVVFGGRLTAWIEHGLLTLHGH